MITPTKIGKFTEDTRVKIPTILHLIRLGYTYLSLKGQDWDKGTNIFPEIFKTSIARINPNTSSDNVERFLKEISLLLDNEDLGRAFFEKLTDRSNIKLIDFENFNNNSFHVVTELTCVNGDEEFRPDITLLINGMPLIFIEVKKPNNREGIIDERNRINERFQNPKFKRFANITQFMIFSNNMEYDDGDPEPIQGAFYASSSYRKPAFNYFREEEIFDLTAMLKPLSEESELVVLKDNNLEVIRNSPEFQINKDHNRPTNRICTSLLNRDRLAFILRYALVYVTESAGIEKHIMRYPQLFATKAIARKLDAGIKKGIIWHTQGSGKTALAYYNVSFLTNYFQQKRVIPKFYFIVDRLDLLQQAQREFIARGLTVHTIDSREAFSRDIKATQVIHNHLGKPEITVVNIQKFKDDPDVVTTKDYDVSIQRVYFLDEVHRSYNPTGSFLANLTQSDTNAIKIGLTGTPLLGTDYNSRLLFGEYIHKYYYDASIADGYTLRLIREEIASNYRMVLLQALKDAEVQMGSGQQTQVYSHPSFVKPMLDYITTDFENSRKTYNDDSIGGMVICASSEQAKQMFALFNNEFTSTGNPPETNEMEDYLQAAEPEVVYSVSGRKQKTIKNAALILHDIGSKQERKDWVEDFKAGKIDLLFVYNMLLTGFDAKRLKKLYLGRVIRKHGLLQALTRVNRTYNNFRYGYVVDFADISQEFDATNKAYFEELQDELGDEMANYSQLFKSQEEIRQEIEHIKDVLFQFDTENAEIFSDQINEIQDRETALVLKNALADARSLYNVIRLQGDYDFLTELDFDRLNVLYRVASARLDLLNLRDNLEQGEDISGLLNRALEDVIFEFVKVGEEELILADKLKQTLRRTREALANNFDQQDPHFITLKEELERLFKKKKLSDVTQNEMVANIGTLNRIHDRIKELNRQNNLLRQKYRGDRKYARTHKRLQESGAFGEPERKIFEALLGVKQDADEKVLNNSQILNNESYFEKQLVSCVINHFEDVHHINLSADAARDINRLIVAEYLNEFNTGARTW
ncbi:type I restriction endonuclease subunit R [Citrobacter freundii]|uniref:type I restriction endonuclease subunit R n=1 Tax=Enterobacter hormaechei TaxID=158836 RepID=UPI000642E384|nr:type I restriction endonuclease [Enterobacter hormaechei]ELK6342913.1 type I restriction endonuclease subunit R [Citrobacter freundii]KLP89375.1 restriction endonuclease subunit R [Enterobacter hormaechei subsp. hoffmannii]